MKMLVVAHPNDPQAYFIARAFKECFLQLGHETCLESAYRSGFDVGLVFYASIWHNFPADSTYKIAYNWECTQNPRWQKKIHRALGQFNCIWECSGHNLKASLPIKRLVCPIGYHPSFELENTCSKKYSVAFIGHSSSRRKQTIEQVEETIHTNVWYAHTKRDAVHAWSREDSVGNLAHNALIHLNIHQNIIYPMFESIRVIAMLLSNKSFVISEPSPDSPLKHGVHYVETSDFPGAVEYYLKHPEECRRIAQQGYEFIKNSYRLENFIADCLRQI